MTPVELFISTLLANSQPLFAFLGLAGAVVEVQLLVLAAIAITAIALLGLGVYAITKMLGNSEDVEKPVDPEDLPDPEILDPESVVVKKDLIKKEVKPKKTKIPEIVVPEITDEAQAVSMAVNMAQQAIKPAQAALAAATEATNALTELEKYCAQMNNACNEYHAINIDDDASEDKIIAALAGKDKAREKCIKLSKQIQACIPHLKAALPFLIVAKKEADNAKKQIQAIAMKFEKIIEVQGKACIEAQAIKDSSVFNNRRQAYRDTAKHSFEIQKELEPLEKVVEKLEKLCSFSTLSVQARDKFQEVVPPKPKKNRKN